MKSSERDPEAILAVLEGWGARLELGRVEALLELFGHPEDSYATVLVAGTNGKGSTSSLFSSMATAGGYRTGLFTSPHLEVLEERFRVDGLAIERSELAALLLEVVDRAQEAGLELPTYFEALTLAGCLWFQRSKVDLAVFEVGMGGRLDATNACTPRLSIVTEIGLDHTKQLGQTLAAIALEKAGIFRPGVPAVIGALRPEAIDALRSRASEIGAPWVEAKDRIRSVEVSPTDGSGHGAQRVCVRTRDEEYELELALPGEHQVRNLLLAVIAAETLAADGWPGLERAAVERGVSSSRWPGRLEEVVLPGGKSVWLDAAHNPQGARALADFVRERIGAHDLLFGILADKDARPVLEAVVPGATRVVLTAPPSDRSLDPEQLAAWLPDRSVVAIADPDVALDRLLDGTLPLVVCGSLYLVGWVRAALRERYGVPLPASEPLVRG